MPIVGFSDFLQEDNVEDLEKMENKGYYVIASKPAPNGTFVQQVEESVGWNNLHGLLDSGTVNFFDWRKYGMPTKKLWIQFMNFGFNVASLSNLSLTFLTIIAVDG
jgi:hypothetical protein